MSDAIISAAIAGTVSLIGTVAAVIGTQKKAEHKQDIRMSVLETKFDALTEEVRMHNGFARRMPVVEEQIKVANNRIKELENECKNLRSDGK